ncbi:MAG: ATP-binding protein [Clostridia bacterium]|nr:ATP-binding protein [Clostridia bacterium]
MKELTLDAVVQNIEAVTDFVNAALEEWDCPMKAQMQIDMAIDELFGNIAQYAYAPGTGMATVRIEPLKEARGMRLTLIDSGKPYDPLSGGDPDTTLSIEERGIGGLGVFLVKKTMDDMRYAYENGQNVLTVEKRF